MSNEIKELLDTYEEYTKLFATQVFSPVVWNEQTGCEIEEYFGYVACCEVRLYDFSTWYEHTHSKEYPKGIDWDFYKTHKFSLLSYHS